MGPRLNRLRNNESNDQSTHEQARDDQESFCIRELSALAMEVIKQIDGKANVEEDYVPLHFSDGRGGVDEYAAWNLATWPRYELPSGVQSYEVFLLEDGRIISQSTDWSDVITADNYDPSLYKIPALNVVSIYSALASLPRDYYFREQHMSRLPS